jgi:hypothetical protein
MQVIERRSSPPIKRWHVRAYGEERKEQLKGIEPTEVYAGFDLAFPMRRLVKNQRSIDELETNKLCAAGCVDVS